MSNPKLFKVTTGNDLIGEFYTDHSFDNVLIKVDDKPAGLFQFKRFSNLTIEGHINLLPEYWGKEISINAIKEGVKWLSANTEYSKLLTDVPLFCENVHRLLKLSGFKPCGIIKMGCRYGSQITDLILYEYDIKKGNE